MGGLSRGVKLKPLSVALGLVAAALGLAPARLAFAQGTTRLLLSTGTGVPGHAGFVFGPFSNLAMNEAKELVFLTTLRSARTELRAVVRSAGVTFSVVAFQGLRSPVPRATYESFSAPSINSAGDIVFTAKLTIEGEPPPSAVIRIKGGTASALVTTGETVPGAFETTFEEFSAPLVNTGGNILFGARTAGKTPRSGLFLWSPGGVQPVPVPPTMNLTANDLLEPVFFSHDEAVFIARSTPPEAAMDQFFRAIAVKSFQELIPPPEPEEVFEALPARRSDPSLKMLIVLMEASNAQGVSLLGDPAQPVMAKREVGVPAKALGRVLGQTVGQREQLLFAANSAEHPTDLGVYCYCEGQVRRLTSPEEFSPIVAGLGSLPSISLVGDSQQTVAFIVPSTVADANSIYVTWLP